MNDLTAAILKCVASSDPEDSRACQDTLRQHDIGTRRWHIEHATKLIQTYGTARHALRAIETSATREKARNA
jgi:hypothetical protein